MSLIYYFLLLSVICQFFPCLALTSEECILKSVFYNAMVFIYHFVNIQGYKFDRLQIFNYLSIILAESEPFSIFHVML